MEISYACRANNLLNLALKISQSSLDTKKTDLEKLIYVARLSTEWESALPPVFDPAAPLESDKVTLTAANLEIIKETITIGVTDFSTDANGFAYNGSTYKIVNLSGNLANDKAAIVSGKLFGLCLSFGLKAKNGHVVTFRQLGLASDKENGDIIMGQNLSKQTILSSSQNYVVKMIINF